MARPLKVISVVGARPNYVKIAPVMEEMGKYPRFQPILVHTGQHYDANMSQIFFQELGLPLPDIDLGVGSESHARQTALVMLRFERVLLQTRPDLVIVVGDVNSTLACALTAAKMGIHVAHVEAGLRSFDHSMPEEINRIVTDALSSLLFTTSRDANQNLRREGVPDQNVFFVGNVMIDTLLRMRERLSSSRAIQRYKLTPRNYALLTLHRPSNTDDQESLRGILSALAVVQSHIEIIFPIHPRTMDRIHEFGLKESLVQMDNLILTEPLGYLDFLCLMANARFVLTDSGGIQEETTVLQIPCLTLRNNTERPVTVSQGTNILVGQSPDRIVKESLAILNGKVKRGQVPELWDGRAASRIISILRGWAPGLRWGQSEGS